MYVTFGVMHFGAQYSAARKEFASAGSRAVEYPKANLPWFASVYRSPSTDVSLLTIDHPHWLVACA